VKTETSGRGNIVTRFHDSSSRVDPISVVVQFQELIFFLPFQHRERAWLRRTVLPSQQAPRLTGVLEYVYI
jgi:hypothetical protein